MVVTVVLISIPGSVGFGGIIGAAVVAGLVAGIGRVGGKNCAALAEIQVHLALEMNRKTEIRAGRKEDQAAARRRLRPRWRD